MNLLITKLGGTASNGSGEVWLPMLKIIINKKSVSTVTNVLGGTATITKKLINQTWKFKSHGN
jgi:hypothetical protein